MELITTFSQVTPQDTDGEDNYNMLKQAFEKLKKKHAVILNACETYYICDIEELDDKYQLYAYTLNNKNNVETNNNPISRFDKVNFNLEADIIAVNEREKFYTFTLVINDIEKSENINTPIPEQSDVTMLTSVNDYMRAGRRNNIPRRSRNVSNKQIKEFKPEPEAVMVPMPDTNPAMFRNNRRGRR